MRVLVINAGSSTLKASIYSFAEKTSADTQPVWKKQLQLDPRNKGSFLKATLELIDSNFDGVYDAQQLDVVGHRVVHCGTNYRSATPIDDDVMEDIELFSDLAPSHNPPALECILATRKKLPANVPQIAVFDTAFHATIPAKSRLYPLPYEYFDNLGIQRFGFHGINHHYCAKRTAALLKCDLNTLNTVTCHLGNGCSLAAVRQGVCIDTTMGYTPLDGLMMGTRSGALDPGVVVHILKTTALSLEELDLVLNKKSGLLGISGLSGDMREVEKAAAEGDERSILAIDMFVHRLKQGIAAMAAALGSLDAITFSAGIGENAHLLRMRVLSELPILNVKVDAEPNLNAAEDAIISSADSKVKALVVHAREDLEIAEQCRQQRTLMGADAR